MKIALNEASVRAAVAAASEEAEEVSRAVLVAFIAAVIARARAAWPVRTGKSREILGADGLRIRASAYAPYIRGGSTWRTLVIEPLKRGPRG